MSHTVGELRRAKRSVNSTRKKTPTGYGSGVDAGESSRKGKSTEVASGHKSEDNDGYCEHPLFNSMPFPKQLGAPKSSRLTSRPLA